MLADGRRAGRLGALRASLRVGPTLVGGALVALPATAVHADTFANAYYDAGQDQVVVTMIYRGTNPNHTFSLKWGRYKESPNGGARDIVAEVLDSQWQDPETQDFRKTTRFSLDNLRCRPAKLILRTAPRFYYTLQIPARMSASP
jgi:hypothetical protein